MVLITGPLKPVLCQLVFAARSTPLLCLVVVVGLACLSACVCVRGTENLKISLYSPPPPLPDHQMDTKVGPVCIN